MALPTSWQGVLLEHWIHNELKAYMDYRGRRGTLGFWRTPSGTEVDFIWWYGQKAVGIEVKAGERFRRTWTKGLSSLAEGMDLIAGYVVYTGNEVLRVGDVEVLPVMEFLKRLYNGQIIPDLPEGDAGSISSEVGR